MAIMDASYLRFDGGGGGRVLCQSYAYPPSAIQFDIKIFFLSMFSFHSSQIKRILYNATQCVTHLFSLPISVTPACSAKYSALSHLRDQQASRPPIYPHADSAALLPLGGCTLSSCSSPSTSVSVCAILIMSRAAS